MIDLINEPRTRDFHLTVLGRTIEHLGAQMYKRRDVAIAELVANGHDAGALDVYIEVPDEDSYDPASSKIIITDNGIGMSDDQIQDEYLVIGRNRRSAGKDHVLVESNEHDSIDDQPKILARPVMGRKGIGKLAGFGIASKMTVITWNNGQATKITLDIDQLRKKDGNAGDVPIHGEIYPVTDDLLSPAGTKLILEGLRHKTFIDISKLRESLSRRFSRSVFGIMNIYVNNKPLSEPKLDLDIRFPPEGEYKLILNDGSEVKYWYAFAKRVIQSSELRGFTIYVRKKTAQAPPFFFRVEGTASGQHATRYIIGAIEADFLDEGIDDESDVVSTDRQEIDWENDKIKTFDEWGQALSRKILRDWTARRGEQMEAWVMENEGLRARIERLDPTSQKQISKFLRDLGQAETDQEKGLPLANSLVRAFEYRHFHDVIQQLDAVSHNPEELHKLLWHLNEWKVLESRAILEVVKGRLDIIDKFHSMIISDAPETPSSKNDDSMHDLLAQYPWLINPEWQVLAEEKSVSRQLRDWAINDVKEEYRRMRYDFLALTDDDKIIIIEIKRSNHAVTLDELQRLEKYKEALRKGRSKVYMLMICGGTYDISEDTKLNWDRREDGDIISWDKIYERSRRYYEHYRSILEGDTDQRDFSNKEREVARTREVLRRGTVHRGESLRAEGLGPQDVDYQGES